jgi:hypothetical protein
MNAKRYSKLAMAECGLRKSREVGARLEPRPRFLKKSADP